MGIKVIIACTIIPGYSKSAAIRCAGVYGISNIAVLLQESQQIKYILKAYVCSSTKYFIILKIASPFYTSFFREFNLILN